MTGFGRRGLQAAPLQPRKILAARKFDVTPDPMRMLLAIFFFGVGALYFTVKLRDPRGLLINHLIELSPGGADIFWGILILVSLGFSAFGVLGLVRSFGEKVFLSLDENAVTGPRSWNSNRLVRIDYRLVSDVNLGQIRDKEFVVITAADGRKIKVGQSHFRVADEWNDFLSELRLKLERN